MEISQIIDVITIAKYGNFTKAANELFISQSALSIRLRRLEEELGFKLFDRTPQNVALTPAGECFCEKARPLVDQWYCFVKDMRDYSDERKNSLKIGLILTANAKGILSPLIDFIKCHQENDISVKFDTVKGLVESLESDQIDVGIMQLTDECSRWLSREYLYYYLFSYETCLMVSREDPLAARESITPVEMEHLPFVQCMDLNLAVNEEAQIKRTLGITPKVVFRSDNLEACFGAVREGVGVKVGSSLLADHYGLAAVPIETLDEKWHVHMVIQKKLARNLLVHELEDHMLDMTHSDRPEAMDHPWLGHD